MKITQDITEMGPDGVPARQTITIEIEPGEDHHGDINGLVVRGRLEAFLEVYGGAMTYSVPSGDVDLWELLTRYGTVAAITEQRLNGLMWAARDTWHWSWSQIALALDVDRSTVRRRVAKARQQAAEAGLWRDATGLHHTTTDDASARLSISAVADET